MPGHRRHPGDGAGRHRPIRRRRAPRRHRRRVGPDGVPGGPAGGRRRGVLRRLAQRALRPDHGDADPHRPRCAWLRRPARQRLRRHADLPDARPRRRPWLRPRRRRHGRLHVGAGRRPPRLQHRAHPLRASIDGDRVPPRPRPPPAAARRRGTAGVGAVGRASRGGCARTAARHPPTQLGLRRRRHLDPTADVRRPPGPGPQPARHRPAERPACRHADLPLDRRRRPGGVGGQAPVRRVRGRRAGRDHGRDEARRRPPAGRCHRRAGVRVGRYRPAGRRLPPRAVPRHGRAGRARGDPGRRRRRRGPDRRVAGRAATRRTERPVHVPVARRISGPGAGPHNAGVRRRRRRRPRRRPATAPGDGCDGAGAGAS